MRIRSLKDGARLKEEARSRLTGRQLYQVSSYSMIFLIGCHFGGEVHRNVDVTGQTQRGYDRTASAPFTSTDWDVTARASVACCVN